MRFRFKNINHVAALVLLFNFAGGWAAYLFAVWIHTGLEMLPLLVFLASLLVTTWALARLLDELHFSRVPL